MEIEPIPIKIKLSKVDWAVAILCLIPFVVALAVKDWITKWARMN